MTSIRACLLLASLAAAGVAQAQSRGQPKPTTAASPGRASRSTASSTWVCSTITHGAPFSDYFPAGSGSMIQKNDYDSLTGLTPSNLSQSRIGLSGNEPLGFRTSAFVFRLETFFNPQSGNISDGLKSVALNNGKPAHPAGHERRHAASPDSCSAGAAYRGLQLPDLSAPSPSGGNVTLLADGIGKYDPMGAAQAFSVIGFSGTTAGGGDTEDRRLDQSVKYSAKYDPVHVGALYQFNGSNGASNTAEQGQLGLDFLAAARSMPTTPRRRMRCRPVR